MRAAGLVLAGGRSSRMGVPKAALEWHGSTLLRRTCGVLQRAGLQPVRRGPGARAGAAAPAGRRRGGRRPARGARPAAGHGGRADGPGRPGRRRRSSAPPTCRSCTPSWYAGCSAPSTIPSTARRSTSCSRWRVATRSPSRRPTGPGWLRWWPPWSRPTGCGRPSSSRTRTVLRLDDDALLADPALRAADPTLESLVNVNERADYDAARARPAPGGDRRVLRRAGHPQRPRAAGRPGRDRRGRRPRRRTWSSTGTCWQRSTATRPAGTASCR